MPHNFLSSADKKRAPKRLIYALRDDKKSQETDIYILSSTVVFLDFPTITFYSYLYI